MLRLIVNTHPALHPVTVRIERRIFPSLERERLRRQLEKEERLPYTVAETAIKSRC